MRECPSIRWAVPLTLRRRLPSLASLRVVGNLATLLKSYVSLSVYSRFKPNKGRKHAS
jgi:hypothetical protein